MRTRTQGIPAVELGGDRGKLPLPSSILVRQKQRGCRPVGFRYNPELFASCCSRVENRAPRCTRFLGHPPDRVRPNLLPHGVPGKTPRTGLPARVLEGHQESLQFGQVKILPSRCLLLGNGGVGPVWELQWKYKARREKLVADAIPEVRTRTPVLALLVSRGAFY
jgi:hypothetical protein